MRHFVTANGTPLVTARQLPALNPVESLTTAGTPIAVSSATNRLQEQRMDQMTATVMHAFNNAVHSDVEEITIWTDINGDMEAMDYAVQAAPRAVVAWAGEI